MSTPLDPLAATAPPDALLPEDTADDAVAGEDGFAEDAPSKGLLAESLLAGGPLTETPISEAAAGSSRRWFERGSSGLGDRIPLFCEAVAAVAAAWTDGFAVLTATPATFVFTGLSEARVAALPLRRGRHPVFAVLEAPGWATTVGLQFDRTFVSTVVEALFGGDDDEIEDMTNGPLTAVERRIAEVIAVQATDALKAGFAEVLPSAFAFERVQIKPDLAFLGRPNATVVVCSITLQTLGQVAEIDLLVARGALDGFVDKLSVLPADEPENTDPRWSERLEGQVSQAPMSLTATVDLDGMTLGALAGLRVGQVLALPKGAATDVRLVCEGRDLFRCDLGQSGGFYTVRVDGSIGPGDPRARMAP